LRDGVGDLAPKLVGVLFHSGRESDLHGADYAGPKGPLRGRSGLLELVSK
jgi:hypothetical protein